MWREDAGGPSPIGGVLVRKKRQKSAMQFDVSGLNAYASDLIMCTTNMGTFLSCYWLDCKGVCSDFLFKNEWPMRHEIAPNQDQFGSTLMRIMWLKSELSRSWSEFSQKAKCKFIAIRDLNPRLCAYIHNALPVELIAKKKKVE